MNSIESTRSQEGQLYYGESRNVSLLLDSLLKGYDKRLRPNYKGRCDVLFCVYLHAKSEF